MRDAYWNRTPERREAARALGWASRTHGASRKGDPLFGTYRSWQAMKRRCDSPADSFYARYGGRGIRYDPRWASFEAFLADMGERPEGRTLDRIDNDGDYEPGNCRWATASEQRQNRPQPRGWKQRHTPVKVYKDKPVECMDGCGASGVTKSVVAKWRCQDCNRMLRRGWMAERRNGSDRPRCSALECPKAAYAKGLCTLHYQRSRKGS